MLHEILYLIYLDNLQEPFQKDPQGSSFVRESRPNSFHPLANPAKVLVNIFNWKKN